jgi:rhodanese-related sulfurtransferase
MTDSNVDRQLAQARAQLRRLDATQAAAAVDNGALLIDIRPAEQRRREGDVPVALTIERNVLEWRLDPTGRDRISALSGPDQIVVVLCSEGYASSLAAVSLHGVGLRAATDVVGGFRAWAAAGLPTTGGRDAVHGDRATTTGDGGQAEH